MKLKYKNILFDVDGTLIDSEPGIVACADYALKSLNCNGFKPSDLKCFMGMVLYEAFREITHLPDELAKQAVVKFREKYAESGLYQCLFYDGIINLIKDLNSLGAVICIATSKPRVFTEKILSHYGISGYFEYISGVDIGDISTTKADVVKRAICCDNCVLIGDRKYDTIGARQNGIKCIGVTYGYGSREEHMQNPPDYIAETVHELRNYLIEE